MTIILESERCADLVLFYGNDDPVAVSVGGRKFRLPMVRVIEPVGDGRLDVQRVKFVLARDQCFRLLPEIADHSLSQKFGHEAALTHNSDVVRLADLACDEAGWCVTLERAKYFDALSTNFAMDDRLDEKVMSLRERLHGARRRLNEFRDDVLVNHIGVVCLIESADGQVVVQVRSGAVANRAWTRSASASGALEFADICDQATGGVLSLVDVARAAVREIREELAIEVCELKFLGLFREFFRGGKPEFYFFAKSRLVWADIETAYATCRGEGEVAPIQALGVSFDVPDGVEPFSIIAQRIDHQVLNALAALGPSANLTLVAGLLLAAERAKRQGWR